MIERELKSAFSLVELSIVLVILGLLTGGILAGQSLIRAAELRSVVTQYNNYVTAAMTFKDKYFAVPGDFSGATRFWGHQVAIASCINSAGAATSSTGVCDGDGAGTLNSSSNVPGDSSEYHQFWRHLSKAGLIEGDYSGLRDPTTGLETPGVNSPVSRINNALWLAQAVSISGSTYSYTYNYGNHFAFTNSMVPVTSTTVGPWVLKPEELWNMDTKVDDGKPGLGNLIAVNIPSCTTSASALDYGGDYRLQESAVRCSFRVRGVF